MPSEDYDVAVPSGHPEVERALLGRLLLGGRGPIDLPNLKPHRFVRSEHRVVYAAILSQSRKQAPFDLISILNFLDRENLIVEAGGKIYIARMIDEAGPYESFKHYTELITEAAARRSCAHLSKSLQSLALEVPGQRTALGLIARLNTIKTRMDMALHFDPALVGLGSAHIGDVYRRHEGGIPWIMAPWVAQGDLVICVGEQGLGKSFMAFQMALAIASGGKMLGVDPAPQKRVLYVDAENNPHLVAHRTRLLVDGMGFGLDDVDRMPLYYADVTKGGLALDTDDGLAMLAEECRRRQPDVVFLDSLMDFQDLDENSNTEMKQWFNRRLRPFMAQHKLTVIVLHHMGKPMLGMETRSGMHRGRGASCITGIADQVWALVRQNDKMLLTHEKCRWGMESSPMELMIEDVNFGNGVYISVRDTDIDLSTMAEKLLRMQRGSEVSRTQMRAVLAEDCGGDIHEKTFARMISRLVKSGVANKRRVGREVYLTLREGPSL